VRQDVPRTGVHRVFREAPAQLTLSRLLRAFARQYPMIGYLQSLAAVGAVVLLVADHDEDMALELLTLLVHVYFPQHFDEGLRGLMGDLDVFHLMLADRAPDLYAHLLALGEQAGAHPGDPPVINAYVSQWLSTLFINVVPLSRLLRIWDALFTEGPGPPPPTPPCPCVVHAPPPVKLMSLCGGVVARLGYCGRDGATVHPLAVSANAGGPDAAAVGCGCVCAAAEPARPSRQARRSALPRRHGAQGAPPLPAPSTHQTV
jgi:hypothetical protein